MGGDHNMMLRARLVAIRRAQSGRLAPRCWDADGARRRSAPVDLIDIAAMAEELVLEALPDTGRVTVS